ncbi:MAG: MFS transporter [Acidimicrobiia bacterium]|nr:MFS transporter [Acidimicrobiia bacterium]
MTEQAASLEAANDTISRESWIAIGAMSLAVFAIANDFTAMNVVLPTLEQDLDTDLSTVQWVVNGYTLMFGVLIVPGGRLADIFGQRKILALGALIFATFSLLGGLAPTIYLLILARILMGVGAAMMWPAILALIYAILPASKAGLAGGLVIGVAGIGNATGPIIAGALAEVSWRYIFFLNVPIAAVAILATWRFVHVETERERAAIDYAGIGLLSVSLLSLLGVLTVAPEVGYSDPAVLTGFLLSVVLMVAFVLRERAAGEDALIPPSVIRNRPFMWACLSVLTMSSVFFASLFYLPQFFQKVLGESTFVSGAMLLPMVGTFALMSFAEAWLINRVGMKAVVSTGAGCMFVGTVMLVVGLGNSVSFGALVPGMVVLGAGIGLFYSSITTAGLTSMEPSRSGLAGGVLYMFQIGGGALGLALSTTVFLLTSSAQIDDDATELGVTLSSSELVDVQGVLVGTETSQELLSQYPSQATQLTEIVSDAFVTGMRWTFTFDAMLTLIGFAIALFAVGGPITRFLRDAPRSEPDDTPGGELRDAEGAVQT